MANLLFIKEATTPTVNEAAMISFLQGLAAGHTVNEVVADDLPAAVPPFDTASNDCAIVSSDCNSFTYDLFNDAIPSLWLSPFRARTEAGFAETGANQNVLGATDVQIMDAASPIADGLSGINTFLDSAQTWTGLRITQLAPDTNIVARIHDGTLTDRSAIGSADPGDQLYDPTNGGALTAVPNYRVFCLLYNFGVGVANAAFEGVIEESLNYALQGSSNQPYVFDTPGYTLDASYSVGQTINIPPNFTQIGLPIAATPSVTSGALPDGISVNPSDFHLVGTFTTAQTPTADIQVNNGEGTPASTTVNFTVVEASTVDFSHDKAAVFLNFEESGDLGNDVSGKGNDATVTNFTAVPSIGGFTNVAQLDGVSSFADLSASITDLGSATDFSVTLKFRTPASLSGAKAIIAIESSTGGDYTLWSNGGTLRYQLRESGDKFVINSSTPLAVNTDYVITAKCGTGGAELWQNKVLVGSDANTETLTSLTDINTAFIGKRAANDLWLDGYIKDVMLISGAVNQVTVDDIVDNDNYGYDLIDQIGDSEAVGRATQVAGIDDDLSVVSAQVVQYGFDAQAIIPYAQPQDFVDELAGDVNSATGLTRGAIRALAYKRKILLVPVADAGTKTSEWLPGQPVYIAATTRMNAALATSALNERRGGKGCLGTNDAIQTEPAGTVATNLPLIMAGFEADVNGFTSSTPFAFVNPIGPQANASEEAERDQVIGEITTFVGTNAAYEQINTSDGNSNDFIHSDAPTQRRTGTRESQQLFGWSYLLDVTVSDPNPGVTPKTGVYTVDVVFTDTVTSFVIGDVSVTNGVASALTGSGKNYSFTVTPNNGTGNNDIVISAGSLEDPYSVANSESNTLQVAYNVAGSLPVISDAQPQPHRADETLTITATYDLDVTAATWNGYNYGDAVEVDPNTLTVTADWNGPYGSAEDLFITDNSGTSAVGFSLAKDTKTGWDYDTLTTNTAGMPANSVWFGLANLDVVDQMTHQIEVDGETFVLDSEGVIQQLVAEGTYNIPYRHLDASNNYLASAESTVEVIIGDNVPDAQIIPDATNQTAGATVYGVFPISGVDLGTTTWPPSAASNCTIEYSNDGINWQSTQIINGGGTQARFVVTASNTPGATVNATATINTTAFTFDVITEAAGPAITDTISSTNPNDTITPVTSTVIDCYGHTVDGVSSNYEQVTTDGIGVFNLVDAGWTTGTWIVSFRDNATGNDLGVQTYVVA